MSHRHHVKKDPKNMPTRPPRIIRYDTENGHYFHNIPENRFGFETIPGTKRKDKDLSFFTYFTLGNSQTLETDYKRLQIISRDKLLELISQHNPINLTDPKTKPEIGGRLAYLENGNLDLKFSKPVIGIDRI
jgi:hypothetical protein